MLGADFSRLGEEANDVMQAGCNLLHLDVMDGHFVPNLTMGPDLVAGLRRSCPDVCLDTHLMVQYPEGLIEPFVQAGSDHLTIHVEAEHPQGDPRVTADLIRQAGATAGLAINPGTPIDAILPYASDFELLLVMSVQPGFAGQSFRSEVLTKTEACLWPYQMEYASKWMAELLRSMRTLAAPQAVMFWLQPVQFFVPMIAGLRLKASEAPLRSLNHEHEASSDLGGDL